MTDDKKYLKETLNQACKNVECLYEFFIKNTIATDYHRIHLSRWRGSFATFSYENSFVTITQCNQSYKVRMALTTCDLIKCDSYKLLSEYI